MKITRTEGKKPDEDNLQNNSDTFPFNAEIQMITGELWVCIIFSL